MDNKHDAAEKLATRARDSLSDYCINECKARCCRYGHLLLTAKEVGLFKDTSKDDLKMIPIETAKDQKEYVLDLGTKSTGCPNLKDSKCMIHKNPDRPKTCKDYPLFIWKDNTIMVTNACQGVRENKLYPFLAEFKSRGYNLIYLPSREK